MKKKAFTLIELIAVLVILAILALIVTPLVMNIIRKARVAADKRSIDAYGRSVELAIANYLLDNGNFPTDVSQLTIDYTGDEVVCSTTQLNSDSSVYLAGCTVAGRSVDYEYGSDKSPSYTTYTVGDEISYNNVDYYVIADSDENEENVTLLKANPLTTNEVNQYGVGHENKYSEFSVGTAYDRNGIGSIVYYNSETCGYVYSYGYISTGCTSDYGESEIKYVVDAWKESQAPLAKEARLITVDDLISSMIYVVDSTATSYNLTLDTNSNWIYGEYNYWTMSSSENSSDRVFVVSSTGEIIIKWVADLFNPSNGSSDSFAVRPVIVLPKSALN